eukprot:scaffold431_cov334-Pavlova_lutheri.AAC.107
MHLGSVDGHFHFGPGHLAGGQCRLCTRSKGESLGWLRTHCKGVRALQSGEFHVEASPGLPRRIGSVSFRSSIRSRAPQPTSLDPPSGGETFVPLDAGVERAEGRAHVDVAYPCVVMDTCGGGFATPSRSDGIETPLEDERTEDP